MFVKIPLKGVDVKGAEPIYPVQLLRIAKAKSVDGWFCVRSHCPGGLVRFCVSTVFLFHRLYSCSLRLLFMGDEDSLLLLALGCGDASNSRSAKLGQLLSRAVKI